MKALVGAFNQVKALVGAFSVIVQPVVEPMDSFAALLLTERSIDPPPALCVIANWSLGPCVTCDDNISV